MKNKRMGAQTLFYGETVRIAGGSSIVSPREAEGPYADYFDQIVPDALWDEESFEKAEQKMFERAVELAIHHANLQKEDVDFMVGGDLLNQIISAGFTARNLGIPFLGVYGACSTMSESLAIGSMIVGGGFAKNVVCATSSHFATAERQFRYPLELGTPQTTTAQNTATAAGATLLSNRGKGPRITHATIGSVVDMGISDANNMGAAMAPAAAETIITHLEDTDRTPDYYDLIVTGDLGTFGTDILRDITSHLGVDISKIHFDCGAEIYSGLDMKCGGSGCGCAASMFNGYLLKRMSEGHLNRILLVATGALLSQTSSQQGESVPSIAHAVAIERGEN